ncbi:hypothetical protein BpHYR1_022927 [Brachionus plicatilis]|uniref:Uncharacterized protein n=1 Tax=Brachionus plicatilis TaxID=10195 RepID=A0A3M7Q6X0_BRAPC|nr:hypothetical protein BpHYR1_022927 [Brachionus plicatilis]
MLRPETFASFLELLKKKRYSATSIQYLENLLILPYNMLLNVLIFSISFLAASFNVYVALAQFEITQSKDSLDSSITTFSKISNTGNSIGLFDIEKPAGVLQSFQLRNGELIQPNYLIK